MVITSFKELGSRQYGPTRPPARFRFPDDDLLGQQATAAGSLEKGELDTGNLDSLGPQEQRRLPDLRRYLLADDDDTLVLVERDGL